MGYENKSCPADSDEHRSSAGNRTGRHHNNNDDGWVPARTRRQQHTGRHQPYARGGGGNNNTTTTNADNNNANVPPYNPRGNGRGGRTGGRGNNNNAAGRGGRGRAGANNQTCTRCSRHGHTASQCNARYAFDANAPRNRGAELPYATCAKVVSGEWDPSGSYLEKTNTQVSNVEVDHISVATANPVTETPEILHNNVVQVQAGLGSAVAALAGTSAEDVDMNLDELDCKCPLASHVDAQKSATNNNEK